MNEDGVTIDKMTGDNKSLQFIKEKDASDRDSGEFSIYNPILFMQKFTSEQNDEMVVISELKSLYDNNAKYNKYFRESYICDGTLLFMFENMIKCIQSALLMQDRIDKIGDLVIEVRHEDSSVKDKPWLRDKFTCFLPVKMKENIV